MNSPSWVDHAEPRAGWTGRPERTAVAKWDQSDWPSDGTTSSFHQVT